MAHIPANISLSEINLDLERSIELYNTLWKMAKTSELISIGLLESEKEEMAKMTSKLNEVKLYGTVKNTFVVLNENYNGVSSWVIPPKFQSKVMIGDDVLVTFQDKTIVDIKSVDKIIDNYVNKDVNSNEKRQRVIPEHGFYVTPEQQSVLDIASKAFHDNNNPYKGFIISLKGEAGYGKTSLAQYFAHSNQLPILIIDCSTIPDNEGWFVVPGFKNHETVFDLTKFSEFLINGNCVILFDEINRMPTWVSNALLPILDHRRYTNVRGIDVNVNNKIAFFMTSNHGASYGGTNPIDQALKRRVIGTISVSALPPDIEVELLETRIGLDYDKAISIVKTFTRLRQSPLKDYAVNISTGTSLNVAWWVKYGMKIRDAFNVAITNDAPDEARKIIADSLSIVGNL